MIESIYVAGKLSGDVEIGKREMIKYGSEIIKKGYIIYLPYWTFDINLYNTSSKNPDDRMMGYDFWVKWFDFYWLNKCDAIFFLPSWKESKGATMEYEEAERLGMRMFFDLDDIPDRKEEMIRR